MSLEKLLEAGGTAVGGVVYVGREAMGQFTADGFVLLDAGKTFLGAENDIAPPAETARQPAKKAARTRAAAEPTPEPTPEPAEGGELGELLP